MVSVELDELALFSRSIISITRWRITCFAIRYFSRKFTRIKKNRIAYTVNTVR